MEIGHGPSKVCPPQINPCKPSPQIVPIEIYFDGNDDMASSGCNLTNHPGMETFRDTFLRVACREDVMSVFAQIAELDPGDDHWPFADTVLVIGTLPREALASELAPLWPDEVAPAEAFGIAEAIARRHDAPILAAWWD